MTDTVKAFFDEREIRKPFVPHLPGNNGDRLMEIGLEYELRKRGIRPVSSPEEADWFIIRGNGAMNDFWRNALDCFSLLIRKHPKIPIAVMPSSYHFEETDFPSLLADRETECLLWTRERYSQNLLGGMALPESVRVLIDHDMALSLSETDFSTRWKEYRVRSKKDYILTVERRDIEHHGSEKALVTRQHYELRSPGKERLLAAVRPFRRGVIRAKWRLGQIRNPERVSDAFRAECRQLIASQIPQFRKLRWVEGDVSDPLKYSFGGFCELIAGAAAVITTRLHVGLLGAMLEVPTFLRCGRYGKIHGVWDYSLRHLPHVRLFENGKVTEESDSRGTAPVSSPDSSPWGK